MASSNIFSKVRPGFSRIEAASPWWLLAAVPWMMGAGDEKPPLQQLDPLSRAKVLAALAGLVILGLAMIALIWLGARVTRRYMNPPNYDRQLSQGAAPRDDWAAKPLAPRQSTGDDAPS